MTPATLTGLTVAGPCGGGIQVSLDGFASCISFAAAAAVMSNGNATATFTPQPGLLVNRTYQIRVTTAAESAGAVALAAQFTTPTGFTTTSPNLCDGSVVISQVYGGGGNSGATYTNDFIELHNRGTTPVSLAGWSVQYASAMSSMWFVTALSGTIQPGAFYLVQEAQGAGGTMSLSMPDATGTLNLSANDGKVALVSNATALSTACPPIGAPVVDLVGYGATSCAGGTPALTNTTSVERHQAACADVQVNSADFGTGSPVLRNSTVVSSCACLVENESNAALEAQYCDTQFPLSLNVMSGTTTPLVYGRVYEMGVTGMGSASATVRAQLGFGPLTQNPEYGAAWAWTNAAYNTMCSGCGNNDEYQASFTAPASGTYGYVYRFSLDQGVSWTYCDNNQGDGGAGSNPGLTFDLQNVAVLTVP
jgi:hypothetical protein